MMAYEYRPGHSVQETGIYRITHQPEHTNIPHEVVILKGECFPTCKHCTSISFSLLYASKHVAEVPELQREAAAADQPERWATSVANANAA
jgi:hypothetical protein